MKVLVIGSGGREHALTLAFSRDQNVTAVHAAPGNPGMAAIAQTHPVDPLDGDAVALLAKEIGADLVVIGPEAPLVAGVADAVRAAGVECFGPTADAARIEGSKAYAKDVMAAANVPTALAHICETEPEAAAALDAFGPPYVVKDDGLAAVKQLGEDGRKEPGNARFEVVQQTNRPNHFTVVEIWKDARAVDAHSMTEATRQFRDKLGPMSGALYDERMYKAE